MSKNFKTLIICLVLGLAVLPGFSAVNAAAFRITPPTGEYPVECTQTLEIYADATGQSSNAADLILFYEPSEIIIEDSLGSIPGKQIQPGNAYLAYAANQVNETIGRIRLTAFSIDSALTSNRLFASIEFSARPGVTSTDFTIQFDGSGETLDSNIADSSNNMDLLTSVINATYTFTTQTCEVDTTPPSISFVDPASGAANVILDSDVVIQLTDNLSGVDLDTLEIIINGDVYTSASPEVTITGDALDYTITINPSNDFFDGASNTIYVSVRDLAGNQRSSTNVFNIPGGGVAPDDCNCGDPITYLLNSDFHISTGNQFIDNLVGDTLNNLGVSGTGAAITGLLLVASLISALVPLLSLLNAPGALINILSYFLGRRHERPWGVIQDASNNQPIPFATCRLYVAGTTNLITQTVSDTEGRYGFVMSPGSYRLEITHNDYALFKEDFTLKDDESAYLKDVKLTPKSMQQQVKQSVLSQRWDAFWGKIREIWKSLRPALYMFGFTLAIVSIIIRPVLLNYIVLGLYALAAILYLYSKFNKAPKFASVVDSATGLRIPYAVVKFYDTEKWHLVDTQVTTGNGQFDFFGEPGAYGVLVAVRGYKFPSKEQTDLELIPEIYSGMLKADLRKGRNKLTLMLDPQSEEAALTNNLEPSVSSAAGSALSTGGSQPASEQQSPPPQQGGNLPTPFG